MEALPTEFREIVVLRDLEGLSYKEIAEVADLPIGTGMSRLARARSRLKQSLHKLSYAGGRPCPDEPRLHRRCGFDEGLFR
jgi:DNA-directed RNA polymerase specialized sigma24 family protein